RVRLVLDLKTLCIIASMAFTSLAEAQNKTVPVNKKNRTARPSKSEVQKNNERFLKKLAEVKEKYRNGAASDRYVWHELSKLFSSLEDGVSVNPSDLLQAQAHVLDKANFPYLSAKY